MKRINYLSDLLYRQILRKEWEYIETMHKLFIDLKNTYNSFRMEVHYSILIEFKVTMKLIRLIKCD
jgi:hypothetical protein